MDLIEYSMACRTCRRTDGRRWSYDWDDQDGQLSIKGRTDFGVMQVLEVVMSSQGLACPLCNSSTLEFFDLAVNGERLFDMEQLYQRYGPRGMNLFSVGVKKVASQLEVQLATLPPQVAGGFLALEQMTELVGQRPTTDFAADANGSFYCCVSGRWDAQAPRQIMYPQTYLCRGLSREEVFFVLRSVRGTIDA